MYKGRKLVLTDGLATVYEWIVSKVSHFQQLSYDDTFSSNLKENKLTIFMKSSSGILLPNDFFAFKYEQILSFNFDIFLPLHLHQFNLET